MIVTLSRCATLPSHCQSIIFPRTEHYKVSRHFAKPALRWKFQLARSHRFQRILVRWLLPSVLYDQFSWRTNTHEFFFCWPRQMHRIARESPWTEVWTCDALKVCCEHQTSPAIQIHEPLENQRQNVIGMRLTRLHRGFTSWPFHWQLSDPEFTTEAGRLHWICFHCIAFSASRSLLSIDFCFVHELIFLP